MKINTVILVDSSLFSLLITDSTKKRIFKMYILISSWTGSVINLMLLSSHSNLICIHLGWLHCSWLAILYYIYDNITYFINFQWRPHKRILGALVWIYLLIGTINIHFYLKSHLSGLWFNFFVFIHVKLCNFPI